MPQDTQLRRWANKLTSFFSKKSHDVFRLTQTGFKFSIFNGFFTTSTATLNKQVFVHDGYGANPLVYMVINKIAQVTAGLPREVEGGNSQQKQLIEQPNFQENWEMFDEKLLKYLNSTGDAFLILTEGVGAGLEWRVAQGFNIQIIVNGIGQIVGYQEHINSKVINHEPENVLHIKYANIVSDTNAINDNSLYGFSPLEALWKTVSSSNEIYSAEEAIFKNRGIVGILTNDSDIPMLPDDQKKIQADFQDQAAGSSNFNKLLISNTKLRYLQTGMSPTDLKLIEGQISNLRDICSAYGLDSSLFNDPQNKTFSNRKEAQIAAYTDVYLPTGKFVDTLKSRYLTRRFNSQVNIEIQRDEIEVLQMNDIEEVQTTETTE